MDKLGEERNWGMQFRKDCIVVEFDRSFSTVCRYTKNCSYVKQNIPHEVMKSGLYNIPEGRRCHVLSGGNSSVLQSAQLASWSPPDFLFYEWRDHSSYGAPTFRRLCWEPAETMKWSGRNVECNNVPWTINKYDVQVTVHRDKFL